MYPEGHPGLVLAGRCALLNLFIPGDPIPKGRPRARVQGVRQVSPGMWAGKPFAQIYTDPQTRQFEEHVEAVVRRQLMGLDTGDGQQLTLPFRGRIIADLRLNVVKPKSYPKSETIPTKARGDVDNMAKSVLDGLANAGVFANDRLVTDLNCARRYAGPGHPEGIEVALTAWL